MAVMIYVLWCVGLAYGGGRDLNWDALNYHLYVPSLLHRPLDQDFMGASMQSYLNPISLLPFYGMVRAQWPAVIISTTLAVVQSLNLVLLHVITDALLPRTMPWRWAFCVAGALLGGSAALFWTELGTSFNDVICSLPVLAAFARYAVAPTSARTAWLTGAMMGIAIGLKLTALPWFAALGLIWLLGGGSDRWMQSARFGWAGLLGFLLVDGVWAARLFHEFGNPFFPFFNEIFRSPLSPPEPLVHRRFMPTSLGAFWEFPWRVALPDNFLYTEALAVDLRPAMMVLVGIALGVKFLVRADLRLPQHESRTLLAILASLFLYYVCWMLLSGNGRYAMAWLLMLGPAVVACWVRLRRGRRWAVYGVSAMLGLQVSSNAVGAVERWASTPWPSQWFLPAVPPDWVNKPHLFLSLQQQSYSFLAHFVHERSSFVNLLGQVPIRPDGQEWARVAALLNLHAGHVRTLMPPAALGPWHQTVAEDTSRQAALLAAYGLTIEPASCQTVVIDPMSDHPAMLQPSRPWQGLTDAGLVVSCSVRQLHGDEIKTTERRRDLLKLADTVFDHLERRCPALTGRRSSVTTFNGYAYARFYVNTDVHLTLRVQDGRITARGFDRHVQPIAPSCIDGVAVARFRSFSSERPIQRD